MRLSLDCERMKYTNTGIFEYCHQLGHALKLGKNSQDEISYYLNPRLRKYFEAGDNFIDQNGFHKFIFPRQTQTDLWHTTYQLSSYIPRNKNIKRILTIHDLNFLHEPKGSISTRKYLHKLQSNIDSADHIIAISSFTKNDIIENLHITDKPITVIHNGCAELTYSDLIKPSYLPLRPFLFALGTVNPKKNFHVLIPLLAGNDYELIIAGKTEAHYKHKILEEANYHNVAHRVKILGPITDEEKSWYYKNCEAFLFPSVAEGFGIPPIEAMRYGKPVFLSNATSLPEIGGSLAYYFHNYDPDYMIQVFTEGMNDYNRRQPADAIIQHAKQFNWMNSAADYWEVYRRVLNG